MGTFSGSGTSILFINTKSAPLIRMRTPEEDGKTFNAEAPGLRLKAFTEKSERR